MPCQHHSQTSINIKLWKPDPVYDPVYNPLPARGPGDTAGDIITLANDTNVSIRSRPGGREIPAKPGRPSFSITSFNPLPARGPGDTRVVYGNINIRNPFQSAPGPGAGRYIGGVATIRTLNAFQSAPGPGAGRYAIAVDGVITTPLFQSAPGPGAGRYVTVDKCGSLHKVFQSAPGPGAGRYAVSFANPIKTLTCFNPLPARGPGDTAKLWEGSLTDAVSIRSRPGGREIPRP